MTRAATLFERARNMFWVFPATAIAASLVLGVSLPALDDAVKLPSALPLTTQADTARVLLQLIATLAVSVAGITFSVIVVALVLASQQLSPRVLRNFQRHPLNQLVLGVFLGTAVYALLVLASVDDSEPPVPELSVAVAMVLAVTSLTLFVFFLHHAVRSLNASAVIRRIAADGHQAVHSPYPRGAGRDPAPHGDHGEREAAALVARWPGAEVVAPRAGYVISVEAADIIEAAEQADAFVEQEAVIGNFVVTGAVIARVWSPPDARDALVERVCDAFVLNEERVVDDDVAFPIRQLVDVALKGLSPGINDPTTAENAMDSVTDTLARLAREPDADPIRASDAGTPRLRTARLGFDALVRLSFDQVRRDASRRPSFSVRLLELLADLRATGGPVALRSEELSRQARLVCAQATALAEIDDDRSFVADAFTRLHGERDARENGRPLAAPADARSP